MGQVRPAYGPAQGALCVASPSKEATRGNARTTVPGVAAALACSANRDVRSGEWGSATSSADAAVPRRATRDAHSGRIKEAAWTICSVRGHRAYGVVWVVSLDQIKGVTSKRPANDRGTAVDGVGQSVSPPPQIVAAWVGQACRNCGAISSCTRMGTPVWRCALWESAHCGIECKGLWGSHPRVSNTRVCCGCRRG